jgi:hypothetical protein
LHPSQGMLETVSWLCGRRRDICGVRDRELNAVELLELLACGHCG